MVRCCVLRSLGVCLLGAVALIVGGRPASAQVPGDGVIAYQVPAGTVGNQNFGGNLGMDFDALVDAEITHLGVFDSGSDGLALTITARLYDRDTFIELGVVTFTPEDPGELIGGSRFKPLPEPIEIFPGFRGTITASGYGASELAGNRGVGPLELSTDDGDCAIAFVGGGRFNVVADAYPESEDAGPANRYAAGTFIFEQLEPSPPPTGGIPYVVPELTFGNQDFGGVLGNEFETTVPILVTRLGVFDSGTDGLVREIEASLWDRRTQIELARIVFSPGGSADPIGGSLFMDLPEPILLPAGFQGTIAAEGYGADEMAGNNLGQLLTDSGSCAILFQGGRWSGTPRTLPQNADPGRAHRYAAGTFEYEVSDVAPSIPNPPAGLTTIAGDGQVLISWSPPATGPAPRGYRVIQTRPARMVVNEETAQTSFVHNGPSNGIEVCYVVHSLPVGGLIPSDASEEVCATPASSRDPIELFTAYEVAEGALGTQNYGGVLGLDFDVRREIAITRIGLFDSGSDGIMPEEGMASRRLVARLWDRSTSAELVSVEFTTEDPGELVGGNRFRTLDTPIVLPAGFRGTISAEGYGLAELAGNTTAGPIDGLSENDGECSIAFVGSRFGPAGFPATAQFGASNRLFAAGTFVYGPFDPPSEPDGGIAYVIPEGTIGNQAFGGPLRMDFNVKGDILITSLGVFDDGSDGLVSPISARLYNRDTQGLLAEIVFDPSDDEGVLIGGSRFIELEEPIGLPAGFRGAIVASGYGAGDQNGNQGTAPIDGVTTDDGGCLIEFVGGGFFGNAAAPDAYPTGPDGGPANRYLAGTFQFEPADGPVVLPPEPPVNLSARELEPGSTSLVVRWDPGMGLTPAAKFEIRRADEGDEDFVVVGSVDAPATEFVDNVGSRRTVCYRVRAIAESGETSRDSVSVCATAAATVPGRHIAYRVAGGTIGNSLVEDAFGLDFDVKLDLTVTRLGVFDDGSNGIARPLTVYLYDRDTQSIELVAEFDEEDPGILVGGSRLQAVDDPVDLPAGFRGTIVVEGYGPGERVAVGNFHTLDPGPCAIEFVGSRQDFLGTFPLIESPNSFAFAAGTFEFEPIETLPPGDGGIAYINPFGTIGNQAFSGSLGMDFDVVHESGIVITRFGVFDDGSDGLNLPITAILFRRDTQEELARLEFTPEDPGELIEGSRFKDLPEPIELPVGFEGTMVAAGYGIGEQNGNQGVVDLGLLTDDAGCLIRFVGGGRWGNVPGSFPTNLDTGPANRYAAGTFEFERGDGVPGGGTRFVRGDADSSGSLNLTDGIVILSYLFSGGVTPDCLDAADANDSGDLNLTDGIYVLGYLFSGGLPPPAPLDTCGVDPTPDNVTCEAFAPCAP